MYFIQVYKLIKKTVFTQKKLIETVCGNWPQLMAPYKLNVDFGENITDEKRDNIHKSHGMVLTNINGKVYFPLGGGYMSDGFYLEAIRKADYLYEQIESIGKLYLYKYARIRGG